MDYAPHPKNPKFEDLSGSRFGSVTVLGYLGKQGIKSYWAYRCDCGATGKTSSTNMKTKKSCGCLHRKQLSERQKTHGETVNGKRSAEYVSWESMIRRCSDPSDQSFPYYGGRGIRVCERWSLSAANFIEDMGRRPSPSHSLDRMDNDGDYEPGNCRWATQTQQQRNRTGCHWVRVGLEVITLQEACDRAGLKDVAVHARMKRGWSIARALNTPSARHPKSHTALDEDIEDLGTHRRATAIINQHLAMRGKLPTREQ